MESQNEISIQELWNVFIRNFWVIFSTTITFFLIFTVYAWLIASPDYRSNADVMVQVEQSSSNAVDPNYDLVNAFRLIDTVAELMEKEIVLENAINKLKIEGYDYLDTEYLRNGLSVNSSSTSYFINISFVDKDSILASNVVDAVISALIEVTDVADAFPVLTIKIRRTSFASEAIYNSPNKILYSGVGILIGLTFGLIFIYSKEFFSTRFRTTEEIENTLKIQVLAVIPKMRYKEISNEK